MHGDHGMHIVLGAMIFTVLLEFFKVKIIKKPSNF